MKSKVHYNTVSEALDRLRLKGYTIDFNLPDNLQAFKNGKYNPGDFQIKDVYRYEGNTDPGDEATVYAIESTDGVKGVLLSGYGSSADVETTELLKKIKPQDKEQL
ncbi:MAG TPA: hypothetical protein VK174_09290 [Chitinophagales bacterium]|nr:hypothetical protein [Chitinophagales bacterium]